METKPRQISELASVIMETAADMQEGGLLDRGVYATIIQELSPDHLRPIDIPVPSGEDIRAMREKAELSQAGFARRLNLSAGYISQLERGTRRPSGPTLVLLDLIRKRGIEAIK